VERRQLTVISAELAGAVRLATVLDPEEFTTTVSAVHRCCSEVFARFGGNTIRIADGELLGYFG
jgi:class 3 adenylate cyclase